MKQFIFQIDLFSPLGYCIIQAADNAAAEERIKKIGSSLYPGFYCGGREVIEQYKGYYITGKKHSAMDKTDGTIEVFNPRENTFFIVCMDDSKNCGHRTFDEASNTVEAARSHIDHVTSFAEPETEQAKALRLREAYINGHITAEELRQLRHMPADYK